MGEEVVDEERVGNVVDGKHIFKEVIMRAIWLFALVLMLWAGGGLCG